MGSRDATAFLFLSGISRLNMEMCILGHTLFDTYKQTRMREDVRDTCRAWCVGGQQQCNIVPMRSGPHIQCSAGGMRDTRACAPLREGNMDPCTHGDTTGITVSSQLQIVGRAFCIGIGTLVPGWFIRFDRW